MPEHLLNISQVAEYLGISEDEVKRLVDIGEIPAYKIGDSFLRFRREQIDAVKREISDVEKKDPRRIEVRLDDMGEPTHPYTALEKDVRLKTPAAQQFDYTFAERVQDFLYYNDFYILSAVIIAILLLIILKT